MQKYQHLLSKVRLGDIYVETDSRKDVKVKDHPYYKALVSKDDRSLKHFVNSHGQAHQKRQTNTLQGLFKLVDALRETFNPNKDPIELMQNKKTRKYIAKHGRHRCCCLLYIYGPDKELVLVDNKRVVHVTNGNN